MQRKIVVIAKISPKLHPLRRHSPENRLAIATLRTPDARFPSGIIASVV